MAVLRLRSNGFNAALRRARPSTTGIVGSTTASTRRTFQMSGRYAASKETMEGSEARKEEIEREKQQQLKKQKEGKNEWNQALASESESIAKADRGELKASNESIKTLQEESAKAAQQERK